MIPYSSRDADTSYDAKAVANFLLDLADAEGESLSPMKLQKLVYYCHGWHLALTGRPLIANGVKAWKFGPVIPSLYHSFKEFAYTGIKDRARGRFIDERTGAPETPTIDPSTPEGEMAAKIIKKVWDVYKQYTAVQLSNLTHEPGTPWYTVWADHKGVLPDGVKIPDELIRDYFSVLARSN